MRVATVTLMLSLAAALLSPPRLLGAAEKAMEDKDAPGPVLLAKGPDFLVHAVSTMSDVRRSWLGVQVAAGSLILHTKPSTGEMKALVTSGTWSIPTERISYDQRRIMGVACDAERLYALVWSAHTWDRPPYPNERVKDGRARYGLSVFWLADGTMVDDFSLTSGAGLERVPGKAIFVESLPDIVPLEALDKGPLSLVEKGVACYGVALEYDGKKLVRTRKLDAPAPGGAGRPGFDPEQVKVHLTKALGGEWRVETWGSSSGWVLGKVPCPGTPYFFIIDIIPYPYSDPKGIAAAGDHCRSCQAPIQVLGSSSAATVLVVGPVEHPILQRLSAELGLKPVQGPRNLQEFIQAAKGAPKP